MTFWVMPLFGAGELVLECLQKSFRDSQLICCRMFGVVKFFVQYVHHVSAAQLNCFRLTVKQRFIVFLACCIDGFVRVADPAQVKQVMQPVIKIVWVVFVRTDVSLVDSDCARFFCHAKGSESEDQDKVQGNQLHDRYRNSFSPEKKTPQSGEQTVG